MLEIVTAPREQWPHAWLLVARIVALAMLVAASVSCLFRDWHRFTVSRAVTNAA